ncbi:MAG TPA: tail fiber protein [Chitinophagaceae bacterium]|jgi:microcystin-dependent protein|nr:tail fiber protein [Chitinophagaceae bacterium]
MYKFIQTTIASLLLTTIIAHSQNVGIGTDNPSEKLEVNGNVKTNGVILNNGGSQNDFLVKSNATGELGYKKAFGAQAINYIICINGNWPSPNAATVSPFLGEIKLFAGSFAPQGWALCQGQLLSISQNASLFSLLGTNYGGNGQSNFALPDLRGATPVGSGVSPASYQWVLGQRTN